MNTIYKFSHYCNSKHLESIKSSHPSSAFWVAGDMNLPDIDWQDNCIDGISTLWRLIRYS